MPWRPGDRRPAGSGWLSPRLVPVVGSGDVRRRAETPSDLVTKLHHAAPVRRDFRQMKGDVLVEPPEERDPVTDQDWQDGITHFVGQPEPKTFGGDHPASNNPDGTEAGPQLPVHELGEITR